MTRNIRKIASLLVAVVVYYVIHEGGHLVVALVLGTFERVKLFFGGLGVQIVANTAAMSNIQLFVFGIAGVVCSMLAGYILVACRKKILRAQSKYLRAIAYYSTMILLLLDPVYLSILYRWVGGGDMNSILIMGIPEIAACIFFLVLLAVNLVVFIKAVLPAYRKRFQEDDASAVAA